MGSIVKKIKKTVKKVIKKNPISKIISKTAKKIKRFGRKVWEGIKKVGGKAMKAWGKISQKIGPIGTIALSFAMPYLLGPLSGAAGTAWNNMATWLGTPATGAGSAFVNTFKNLGLNVMKGTQFVGSTFKGITQTLSKTIGSFGQGDIAGGFSNLWKGAGDVFSGRAGMGTLAGQTSSVMGQTVTSFDPTKFVTSGGVTGGAASGVVQTGGVNMLNANIANAQSYKIISNAMASTVSGYTPEMSKYVNTLQKQYKLDAFTAHEHAMKNGGVINIDPTNQATTYNLDFNSSGDFKFQQSGGPPNAGEYQYTGDASKISFGETNQYVGMRGNQYEIKGETYGYGDAPKSDSLLNKGSKALSAMLNNDDNQELEIPGGVNPSLDPYSTLYGGTNVASAGGGQFLTQAQQQFFVEQDLNIARG